MPERGGLFVSLFCCPICAAPLCRTEKTYRCPAGHCFDRAREGYVHLLPANRKHSKNPGDDQGMAAARNRFLSQGWYAPLRARLEELALACPAQRPDILDSGCGEGYYTQGVFQRLRQAGRHPQMAGVDLSRASVRYAARRVPEGEFAVASVYHLPVADDSIDLLVNCFSPLALEEFRRVLRADGRFLYVVPGPEHLWELKQVLYERPYRNREVRADYPGFCWLGVERVRCRAVLPDRESVDDLFHMTPYYWKTPAAGAQRLKGLDRLEVQLAFDVHVYRREDETGGDRYGIPPTGG